MYGKFAERQEDTITFDVVIVDENHGALVAVNNKGARQTICTFEKLNSFGSDFKVAPGENVRVEGYVKGVNISHEG